MIGSLEAVSGDVILVKLAKGMHLYSEKLITKPPKNTENPNFKLNNLFDLYKYILRRLIYAIIVYSNQVLILSQLQPPPSVFLLL